MRIGMRHAAGIAAGACGWTRGRESTWGAAHARCAVEVHFVPIF